MIMGTTLMGLGFVAVLVMLSGLMFSERPPSWIWGMLLWIGAGAGVFVSAFLAAARDRRDRTRTLLEPDQGAATDR